MYIYCLGKYKLFARNNLPHPLPKMIQTWNCRQNFFFPLNNNKYGSQIINYLRLMVPIQNKKKYFLIYIRTLNVPQ